MARVTNTPARLARKRRLLKAAKGFWGARKNRYKVMKETVHRAWAYAYRGRRLKKRDYRSLWIVSVSAAARARGMMYSRFVAGLKKAGVDLNRKVLSEVAIRDPKAFDALVEMAKQADREARSAWAVRVRNAGQSARRGRRDPRAGAHPPIAGRGGAWSGSADPGPPPPAGPPYRSSPRAAGRAADPAPRATRPAPGGASRGRRPGTTHARDHPRPRGGGPDAPSRPRSTRRRSRPCSPTCSGRRAGSRTSCAGSAPFRRRSAGPSAGRPTTPSGAVEAARRGPAVGAPRAPARPTSPPRSGWTPPGPARARGGGSLHPVSQMCREVEDLFLGHGLRARRRALGRGRVAQLRGAERPADHPARDLQDTFWLADGHLLRTHT